MMSELHAVLGLVQLERFDEFIRKRAVVAEKYNKKFKDVEGVRVSYIDKKVTRMSWFVYVIQLDSSIDRDRVMKHLLDSGIGCRLRGGKSEGRDKEVRGMREHWNAIGLV